MTAYLACREHKRNTPSALAFEMELERNLAVLYDELAAGTYRPGRSICFVVRHPKPREVWAAGFRDRVVHHLLYRTIGPRFERSFIADSCACMAGRGTLYAARRLEHKVRSITQNWTRRAFYLKCDVASFFVSIDKRILGALLSAKIGEQWWQDLADIVLWHDPREDYEFRGSRADLSRIPAHKSLLNQPAYLGLPIGNLSSQFFANVYLNELDQHVKHHLRVQHYVRYVDDFILLDESTEWLNFARADVEAFLPAALRLRLNAAKTILQPIARGVDFVGHLLRPHYRTIRPRTVTMSLARVAELRGDVFEEANSYYGLLRQASHSHADRSRLSRVLRRRGYSVDSAFTKIFRRP